MRQDLPSFLVPDCPPPRATVTPPSVVLPRGATDCHFHVFGPYASFPPSSDRTYTPPEASYLRYREVAAALGVERFVIVQASIYGSDNRCTLAALSQFSAEGPEVARAVIGMPAQRAPQALWRLHGLGVRGVRYNGVTGHRASPDELRLLAAAIAPLGWHLQVYVGPGELEQLLPVLMRLPVEVVIDHLGGLDPADGVDGPAFGGLLRFLDSGRAWLKLVGYRCSHETAPYADLTPYVRHLAGAHGDRLVWGTDWPHPVRFDDMPEDGSLVDALAGWLDDAAALRAVLVDNPARLYGFDTA